MADSINRSIAKTITWRIIAIFITMVVSYYTIGMIHPEWPNHAVKEAAIIIGMADMFIKLFMYFIHERLWTKIK
ncbi:DUF2061 domain-containing protein [bacterium]|nr:DUF2061 domain-containing protein [bacterium]|tara:strand:+ start:69 stop:290 length:222 start_codon:yes stop_codon:yes gene_type:complete